MQDTNNRFHNNKAGSDGQQETKENKVNGAIKSISRPLRIFQFMVSLGIFAFVIFTIVLDNQMVSFVICILLIILSGVYVFILAVDLISQYSGGELHAIPTLLFSFLGTIFFGIAASLVLSVYYAAGTWYILTILCLCILMCILCTIHVAMELAFWKRRCNTCKQCCYVHEAEMLRSNFCDPMCAETVKYDLMTSVSSLKVASGEEDGAADHSYRKVGYGHRRQYVDCPTSAQTVSVVDVAQVQTDPNPMSTIQSQTQREMKEIPVQTMSRCELCNRQMQYFTTASSAAQPAQPSQCAPCPALVQLIRGVPCCPGCRCVTGIVQLQQQQEKQQEEQSAKGEVQWVQSMDKKPYGTLTSADNEPKDSKMKEMSGTITKLTVASYTVGPSKKTNTSCQTTKAANAKKVKKIPGSGQSKEIKESIAKREEEPEKDVAKKQKEILIPEREKAKETTGDKKKLLKSSLKKSEEPTTGKLVDFALLQSKDVHSLRSTAETSSLSVVDETEANKGNVQQKQQPQASTSKEETVPIKDETVKPLPETKELSESEDIAQEINIDGILKETQNIGGEDIRITWAESAIDNETVGNATVSQKGGKSESDKSKFDPSITKKVEQSMDTASIYQPETGTQTMQTEVPSSRSKKTHLIRKNKVEPAELTYSDINVQSLEAEVLDEISTASTTSKPELERLFAGEKEISVEDKTVNICVPCKRTQAPPISARFRYSSVHKDKRGRLYCEYCATPNSIKVLHGNDGSEQKRLKCTGCGNFLRIKTSQNESVRNKSDNCPKCGQVQERVQSAP